MLPPIQHSRTSSADRILPLHETGESSRSAAVPGVTVPVEGAVTRRPTSQNLQTQEFPPSLSLAREAQALAKQFPEDSRLPVNLEQSKDRMILEGRYLKEHKGSDLPFHEVVKNLGLESAVVKEVQAGRHELLTNMGQALQSKDPEQLAGMTATLRTAMQTQTRLMNARAALYNEILKKAALPETDSNFSPLKPEEKANIERSQLSFSKYAEQLSSEIPLMLELMDKKASVTADTLKEASGMPGVSKNEELQTLTRSWEDRAKAITKIKKELVNDFTVAAQHGQRMKTLGDIAEKNSGMAAAAKAYASGGGSQIFPSGITFGTVRGSVESAISNPAGRIATNAVAMTLSHNLMSDLVRTATSNMFDDWAVVPNSAKSLIPDANPRVSEGGVTRLRNPEELKAAQEIVENDRARFADSSTRHKVGSMSGNFEFFTSFATAQAMGAVYDLSGGDSNTILGKTIKSMAGGLNAGGMTSLLQLRNTMTDSDGNKVHTHTFSDPKKTRNQAFQATASSWAKSLDYSQETVRKITTSKAAGIALGLAGSAGLDALRNMADESTTLGKAGIVTTAALGPPTLLGNMFAGMNLNADVAADKTADDKVRKANNEKPEKPGILDAKRLGSAYRNVVDPNRPHVKHGSEAGTWKRAAENTTRRVDGASALISQVVPDALSTAGNALKAGYNKAEKAISERASREKAQPQAHPAQPQVFAQTTATEVEEIELTQRRVRPGLDNSDNV